MTPHFVSLEGIPTLVDISVDLRTQLRKKDHPK